MAKKAPTKKASAATKKAPAKKPAPKEPAPKKKAAMSITALTAERAAAAREKAAKDALARMGRLKTQISDLFYDLALELKAFRDKRLHVALGHASFDECLEDQRIVGRDVAQKLLAIVDSGVSREVALAYGSHERAYASLRLTRATKRVDDSPATLIEEGVTIEGVPATEASVRTLEAALRKELAKGGKRASKPSPTQQATEDAARALSKAIGRVRGASAEVRAKHGKAPRVVVELSLESAAKLVERLSR